MKFSIFPAVTVAVALWCGPVQAQLSDNYFSFSANLAIPSGDPIGLALPASVSGLSGAVADISVSLDITGGFNGSLYAYLAGPNGQLAILLNRVGVGVNGVGSAGYSDAGFNITLSDSAANGNIHNYQNVAGYAALLQGGTWAPDGRNIDPLSAGSTLIAAPTTSDFSVFNGINPNGTWTLFIADLASGGGTATLDSAVLDVTTVPEPSTWVLMGGGLATVVLLRRRLG